MQLLLFYAYIFDKCGYYGAEKDNTCLSYEIEYMLSGKSGDIENLEEIVEKIFKIRYVVNLVFLMSDPIKKAEALELATAICAVIPVPGIEFIVQKVILLAWTYAESAKDLRILFSGHRLSIMKTANEWSTPLTELVTFKNHLDSYKVPNGVMGYKEFLYAFVLLKSNEDLNMKLMDTMEMNMRITPGNENFKMNNQIYQLAADVNVSSRYGPFVNITRSYSYW